MSSAHAAGLRTVWHAGLKVGITAAHLAMSSFRLAQVGPTEARPTGGTGGEMLPVGFDLSLVLARLELLALSLCAARRQR